jgi:hypothetical protein
MNTSKQFLLQTLSLGAFAFLIMATTDAGLYRWVDASGKIHFSDKVPAKVAKQGHSELGQNGVEKNKVLSADELLKIKAEKDKNAEENKLLANEAKKQKLSLEEKAKRDEYLLLTYDSKKELNNFYENKLAMLSGTADILVSRNEMLERKLSKLKLLKTVNKKNKLKITDIVKTIKQYSKALKDNQREVTQLKERYKQDLKRYSELTIKITAN